MLASTAAQTTPRRTAPGHAHAHGSTHAHAHAHAHGHKHAHAHAHQATTRPTPEHFLTHNPCDAEGFSEVCACCQGAIDVDEFMGLKAAAPHDHSQTKLHLPASSQGWAIAAVTAWATLPGIYFGVQNFRAASTNVKILHEALAGMQTEGMRKVRQSGSPDVRANYVAYAATLKQSHSMQRFISVFAGALPALGSACMLGSVVAPVLGAVGGGFLLVYCLSHITRYMTFEWPRVRQLQAQLDKAALREGKQPTPAELGLKASMQLLQQRQRLYPQAATAFGVYAAGATLLTAGVAVATGAGLLAVGLGAVLYLNNGPIKASYGKNGDRDVHRIKIGSQTDLLQRIGRLHQEGRVLQAVQQRAREEMSAAPVHAPKLQLRATRAVRLGLSYGLTFGICNLGRDLALERLRRVELSQLSDPEKLVSQYYRNTQTPRELNPSVAALYQILYQRPDEVTHQMGALLDHFHARVATEGLKIAHG